jgi:hypothetical protein
MKNGILALAIVVGTAAAFLLPMPGESQGPPPGGRGGFGRGGFGRGRGAPRPPAGPFTRLPDGHPNMNGYWNGRFGAAVFAVPGGRGPITDPADKMIPYLPWARQEVTEIAKSRMFEEPSLHCYEAGVPGQMWVQFGNEIVQSPGYVVFNWEFMHAVRIIPTDGRPHISPNVKLFQGDEVGHWEGDTLVVDTTNNNGRTWFDTAGNINPVGTHVVERMTMKDANTISYEATISNPKAFSQPWKVAGELDRNLQKMSDGRPYEQMEFACIEGNRDVSHYTKDKGGKADVVRGPAAKQ